MSTERVQYASVCESSQPPSEVGSIFNRPHYTDEETEALRGDSAPGHSLLRGRHGPRAVRF